MQLQDGLLKTLCDGKVMVSIYLTNGIRLSGRINTYDRYCIVLDNDSHTASQVVYKHAISTISPQQAGDEKHTGHNTGHGSHGGGHGSHGSHG
ncbi:RNA chaperone Hfq [Beggiatoa alba]|nr:RNA chaperone Hfq [Beggiatoa alba]